MFTWSVSCITLHYIHWIGLNMPQFVSCKMEIRYVVNNSDPLYTEGLSPVKALHIYYLCCLSSFLFSAPFRMSISTHRNNCSSRSLSSSLQLLPHPPPRLPFFDISVASLLWLWWSLSHTNYSEGQRDSSILSIPSHSFPPCTPPKSSTCKHVKLHTSISKDLLLT